MFDICIYHGNCADGFTAAWAVWKKYPDIEFHPGFYGEPPPNVEGKRVVMVDFSYKRSLLFLLAEVAESILILDHHASAEKDLKALPGNVTAIFDMDRSGAMMAWNHFHPDTTPGSLVKHVQDRDLWRFNMEQTRAFQANLFSYEYTFENWDMIDRICADDYKYWAFIGAGEAIERKHFKDVNELIKKAATRANIAGYDVPVLNCPYFYSSDAGHLMGETEQFAACYWDEPEHRVYSLRSSENGIDVSEIAVLFGGGGHKHASGFQIKHSELDQLQQKRLG